MAEVRPLKGLRYSLPELEKLVTPPYDIIDSTSQGYYYEQHPNNIIRLELGNKSTNDTTLDNVYTRAAAYLSEWRLQGILRQESDFCYYVYQQRFSYNGNPYIRTSLLARVRLEPWEKRVILPHENTFAQAKEDRLQLLRATATNLSPILSLYTDPHNRILRLIAPYAEQAEIQFTDEQGVEHRLHPIQDATQISHIQDFFEQRQLYIADGHHRYTTALTYQQEILEQRKKLHPDDGSNFVLMALVDVEDPGMLILPTHRLLIDLSEQALSALSPEALSAYFTVQPLEQDIPAKHIQFFLAQAGQHAPSLVLYSKERTLLLSLQKQGQQEMSKKIFGEAWRKLDVAIVQHLILEQLLHLNMEELNNSKFIQYTHNEKEAIQRVQQDEAQIALILNAPQLDQVCEVAQANDRMPQKSTYLYPKLITGLVMHPLW